MTEEHIEQMRNSIKAQVEQLKELENPKDLNILDADYTVKIDGTITGIKLITATGGPQIEIDLVENRVKGFWGGDVEQKKVRDSEAVEAIDKLYDYYEELFEVSDR